MTTEKKIEQQRSPLRYLRIEDDGPVRVVTLNRPEVLNALNRDTIDELRRCLLDSRHEQGVGALILTGAGDKSFIAGADISELARQEPVAGRDYALSGQHVFGLLETLGKPTIAAINGYALGGGCELALCCHVRLASENARLGQPEVKLGIIPGYGGSQRLPRLVGRGRALELLLTGEMITAQEAYRIGLVNRVTTQQELLPAAKNLANTMLKNGPLALRCCIEAVHYGLDMSLQEGLFLEASLFALTCTTEDMKEGTNAFLEKRQARFQGR